MAKIKLFCCIFPAVLAASGTTLGKNTPSTHAFVEPNTVQKSAAARKSANDPHPWASGNRALAD